MARDHRSLRTPPLNSFADRGRANGHRNHKLSGIPRLSWGSNTSCNKYSQTDGCSVALLFPSITLVHVRGPVDPLEY